MGLERRSATNTIFLQVKHYSLWQDLKKPVEGSESVEVTNPQTKEVLIKHGFAFRKVSGRVVKVAQYDTEKKFAKRYFGFKFTLREGADTYVLDMPYESQALRRFLAIAPNVNWDIPLSITVFKGKKEGDHAGAAPTVVWFQQNDETVKAFFTKDHPNGMPTATQDPMSKTWDFRAQRSWLTVYFLDNIVPLIEMAAARVAPPAEPAREPENDQAQDEPYNGAWDPGAGITDDDVPF